MLKENCDNRIPDQREGLQSLPGVGRKSANVILNVLFGQETLAVDTHIFRVANRIGLTQTKTPEATERALLECIPKKISATRTPLSCPPWTVYLQSPAPSLSGLSYLRLL